MRQSHFLTKAQTLRDQIAATKEKRKLREKRPTAKSKTIKLMPKWKKPTLKHAIKNETKESDTVEGSKMFPPTNAMVSAVERSIDDYKWSEPGSTPRGNCQTNAALSPFWGMRPLIASALKQSNAVLGTYCRSKL